MATAAAASASEPEAEPPAGPKAEGEEDEVKAARTRRKVLSRAVAAATYKTMGPGWEQQEEGVSESDGDEEYAMASSADSSAGDYEWEYDEEEEKNQLEIERLEEQLSINVYDYNCHVDLIRLLRLEGELTKVRVAREKMSEIFPLTEELWLEWLHDEISMALDGLDREHVYELFEKAVKDYICPNIWLEYGQYSVGGIGQKGGLEKVRSVFERALSSVGLHMTKGLAIWEAYREFESAIVEAARHAWPNSRRGFWVIPRFRGWCGAFASPATVLPLCPEHPCHCPLLKWKSLSLQCAPGPLLWDLPHCPVSDGRAPSQVSSSRPRNSVALVILTGRGGVYFWAPPGICSDAICPMAGFLSPFDREQTFDSQLEKVHSLFRRQLAIPLYGKRNGSQPAVL
ncbi:hypothetical protein GHT09_016518 [Marmota monax]|uniref:Squamous cell carcinoma antigen recognized by T-cells 3 n=1 Tax=Marmota monax TaxID=9995 RepID=A0A834UUT9_MARMO|nr:hypothetical protein GHT09_016518 [Marmota monax]